MVHLFDTLTLDAPRRTSDGYLAVRAKAARTGTYQYLGSEIDPANQHGLRDAGLVNVLRDENTVFDAAAVRSFIGKPITDNHPTEPVTADNWRDHARGVVMGAIRDGEYVSFDLLLTDAGAIGKVQAGKRELSNGYGCDLEFGKFTAADGTVCVARQKSIAGNHVALVDAGRAGPECAIKDGRFAHCDANPAFVAALTSNGDTSMKTLTIDGLKVPNVSDEAEAAINKLLADNISVVAKLKDSEAKVAELTTNLTAKDAEVTTLKQQAEDSKITPAKLRDAAKAYVLICDKAKALGVQFAEDADADAIMAAVVKAKLGDKAKDWTADQIAISFDTLTATQDAAAPAIGTPKASAPAKSINDARSNWLAAKENAHRAA